MQYIDNYINIKFYINKFEEMSARYMHAHMHTLSSQRGILAWLESLISVK